MKVLIKNVKVSYFYNSQRKKTNHEPVTHWSYLTNPILGTSLLFIKERRSPGNEVSNLFGFSTPFLLRCLYVSIFWICGSNEALTTKHSTIITHHAKDSWVLSVLLRCLQMTNDAIKYCFSNLVSSATFGFSKLQQGMRNFTRHLALSKHNMVMGTRLMSLWT